MSDVDFQVLIQGVQQGDSEAFGCLLEHVRPTLANYIRRHHPQPEDQNDILQETFFNTLVYYGLDQKSLALEHYKILETLEPNLAAKLIKDYVKLAELE